MAASVCEILNDKQQEVIVRKRYVEQDLRKENNQMAAEALAI
jgi:hypothetical protein